MSLLASASMWVRSYRIHDELDFPDRLTRYDVCSADGRIFINNGNYVILALQMSLGISQAELDALRDDVCDIRADNHFAEGGGQFLERLNRGT